MPHAYFTNVHTSTQCFVKYHLGAFTNLILYYEALCKVCFSVSFIYYSLIIHPTFNNDDWDITDWWWSAIHVRAHRYKYPQLSIRTAAVVVTFLMNRNLLNCILLLTVWSPSKCLSFCIYLCIFVGVENEALSPQRWDLLTRIKSTEL